MEQMRVFIAIALSFLVFFLWSVFFTPEREPVPPSETTTQDQPTTETTRIGQVKQIEPGTAQTKAEVPSKQGERFARDVTVDTPLYRVIISEKGAEIRSLILKNYRESVEPDSAPKELIATEANTRSINVELLDNSIPTLKQALYTAGGQNDSLTVRNQAQSLSMTWQDGRGFKIEKIFRFDPESYLINLTLAVTNESENTLQDSITISLAKQFGEGQRGYGFQGPSALIDGKLEQVKLKKVPKQRDNPGEIGWVAVQDRYFMSGIVPGFKGTANMRLVMGENGVLESRYVAPQQTFTPGTVSTLDFDLYFGPKSMKVLNRYENDLKKAINFGMFDVIAKPCLWFMNFLHDNVVGNYGIAIIILTLCTKVLLWPLGNKSYKSMNAMKKLQPLMAEIRERHKGDKQQMNRELMSLYKTYKINPMGGCLPMILQIPVFFALYRMLYEAIELRHAPFILWINDLAAPDRLFNFDFSIPFMQAPYGIPVLTIVMGGSMLLQQKMSPPPGDPTQAKMMMLMPVVFTFIFINFSSGLVLYWLINNLSSIGQQYYIGRKNA